MPHLSNGQGSTHSRLIQVWVRGHSLSLLHPAEEVKKQHLENHQWKTTGINTFKV